LSEDATLETQNPDLEFRLRDIADRRRYNKRIRIYEIISVGVLGVASLLIYPYFSEIILADIFLFFLILLTLGTKLKDITVEEETLEVIMPLIATLSAYSKARNKSPEALWAVAKKLKQISERFETAGTELGLYKEYKETVKGFSENLARLPGLLEKGKDVATVKEIIQDIIPYLLEPRTSSAMIVTDKMSSMLGQKDVPTQPTPRPKLMENQKYQIGIFGVFSFAVVPLVLVVIAFLLHVSLANISLTDIGTVAAVGLACFFGLLTTFRRK